MTFLVLLEPEDPEGRWEPFSGARPVAELRAGAWRIRERWEQATGLTTREIIGSRVAGFVDVDAPPVLAPGSLDGDQILLAASDFVPASDPILLTPSTTRLMCNGRAAARVVQGPGAAPSLESDAGETLEIGGLWLGGSHGLLDALDAFLADDCLRAGHSAPPPSGAVIIGDASLVRAAAGTLEPGVVFDVRQGAVVVSPGAEVRSGARLEGPCWIGGGARVVGGFVRRSCIGPRCVVRGEVSNSVFLGYSNKAHEGFVGHSVLGHWVNLGALTTTSNLKNTYGTVRLDTPRGAFETGRQFLGSLIGDHAKTAIGTMLGTGTVVGAGANVFGDARPPRWIPPFAWGSSPGERMSRDGFLTVARRVLPRREVEVTPAHEEWLAAMYQRLA